MTPDNTDSWGRTVASVPAQVLDVDSSFKAFEPSGHRYLPYGLGRSYGDVCLNNGGTLLRTRRLNSVLEFDATTGVMKVEAGAILVDVLDAASAKGWYVPVIPGTGFVTIGGAVANDIHGKNHHRRGTFGCHVLALELLRSDGLHYVCSKKQNEGLFRATIGGMGLTGMVTWVQIQLMKIGSTRIAAQTTACKSWRDIIQLLHDQDKQYEYTVAWVDAKRGRGHVIAGNHVHDGIYERHLSTTLPLAPLLRTILFDATADLHNIIRFFSMPSGTKPSIMSASKYFHPLDVVPRWNTAYGDAGFFQYQFVVPYEHGLAAIESVIRILRSHDVISYLSVLKIFGTKASPGIMSFPQPGLTLALDVPNKGLSTLTALAKCDEVILKHGGRIYPAKDARTLADTFQKMYEQQLPAFTSYIDPHFSSTFWRRVVP
ncbi:MAG: FAD-binding oxidoreductase [Ignavibacteria bacterium]|nr:FAD-binding oxidoreductase [Ignavibacteria bacterium]